MPQSSTYPKRIVSILLLGLGCMLFWTVGLLIIGSVREHVTEPAGEQLTGTCRFDAPALRPFRRDQVQSRYQDGRTQGHRRRVLDEVDWTIRPRSQLVILGVDHVDCTTLLDIAGGAQLPTSGWVERNARVVHASWIRAVTSGPITPRQLIGNLSKIYRVDIDALIEFIDDFAELGLLMKVPIRALPRNARQRLGVGLIYGIPAEF